jgi:hypothetical protein
LTVDAPGASNRTILVIVSATLALTSVMNPAPSVLKMTAMMTAARGVMQRVETAVAMALGASVHPLTKMTPRTRTMLTTSAADIMMKSSLLFSTSWRIRQAARPHTASILS